MPCLPGKAELCCCPGHVPPKAQRQRRPGVGTSPPVHVCTLPGLHRRSPEADCKGLGREAHVMSQQGAVQPARRVARRQHHARGGDGGAVCKGQGRDARASLGTRGQGVCTTCVRATRGSLQYNSGPKGAPSSQSQGPTCQLHARQAASLHDDVLHLGAKPHLAPKMDEVLPAPLKGAMARRPGMEQSARTPIARQYSRLCSKTLASAARGIAGPQNRDPTPT